MPLTEQDRAWHETYEQLGPVAREAVDTAYSTVFEAIRRTGHRAATDDRAEMLVAALTRFLVLSNPQDPDLMTRSDLDARQNMIEAALKHKDLFGTAATKVLIYRFGRSKSLAHVPVENVASLHRAFNEDLDREAKKDEARNEAIREIVENRHRRAGDSVVPTRAVGKHPDLGAPYGRSVDTPHGRQPVLVHESTPSGIEPPSHWPYLGRGQTGEFTAPDEDRKPVGGGGGFDGGGASGSWDSSSSDSSSSSSDSSSSSSSD